MDETYGQIAYNAYCDAREWKSIKGEPLPKFGEQLPELQAAWEKAATAVIEHYDDQSDPPET